MIIESKNDVFTLDKQLLFLHGYLADRNSFYHQLSFFERDYQVFAPDFKGFGLEKGMQTPYCLDDYVLDLKEYMYKEGIKNPHVVAHSFGGRVALKCASQDEVLFDKLVLTGCAGLKPKATLSKALKKTAFNLLKKFISKDKLKRFYSSDYLALDEVMRKSFIKIVNEHLDGVLSSIKNQTLLIFGKNDKETPLYMAKRLNKGIKNSSLLVFENAGHFCFLDKPIKFNTEVKEFLLS